MCLTVFQKIKIEREIQMIINKKDYVNKVLGCWMGKNIGGTLGAPFEWKRQVNNVEFYTQALDGNPLPNDDLDIQLIWLIALEEQGISVDAKVLADYWMLYVTPHWAEYGTAKINMRSGLMPPLCGTVNNVFKDSCGCYIRAEIWACIAPGCPQTAVKYAYEDAIIDHGNGEGMYGEAFIAALESAAFVEKDIRKLIDIGLSYIPEDCGVAKAVKHTLKCYDNGMDWLEARNEILDKYRGGFYFSVAPEDIEKGFDKAKIGWDVPGNIAMTMIGLIYGEGDFDKSMCTAVNCGEDTDCTAATLGSILGIINGIDWIPEKWIKPIGRQIKTACLNLGELGGFGSQLPGDIYELTDRVESIARQVILRNSLPVAISEQEVTDIPSLYQNTLYANGKVKELLSRSNGPVYRFPFMQAYLDYGDGPYIKDGEPKKLKLIIENTYKLPANINLCWYSPESFCILPSKNGKVYLNHTSVEGITEINFEILAEKVPASVNRFVLELTVDGFSTVMHIPVVLINDNYQFNRFK